MTTGIPGGEQRASTNQPPPLVGHNVVTSDAALVEAVTRHAAPEVVDDLASIGASARTRTRPG
jgi:putative acyl-CoA dehydrogenase